MNIYPVIMCGGAGTRLWPASRPSRPKQFIGLVGEKSLFRETAERVSAIPGFKKLIIVAGIAHGAYIARELQDMSDAVVLLEPEGRDSAPAIAVATQYLSKIDPDGIAAVVASDHFISDIEKFGQAIATAAHAASDGRIVTMGIVPSEPTTAYGYISGAQPTDPKSEVRPVSAFVEKPDAATAQRYIEEGYLWNSGNFVFSAQTMIEELQASCPDMLVCVQEALEQGTHDETGIRLGAAFLNAQKISIDYAVMEKTRRASVLPVSLDWSDLGAWDAVYEVSQKDAQQNAKSGNVINVDTKNSYLRADDEMTLACYGVDNLAIVAQKDSVLICPLDKAQSVKQIVEQLREQKNPSADIASEDRPATLKQMCDYYTKWLHTKALPLWCTLGADYNGWGFHESLTQAGAPTGANRRARVQARQIYVYAVAGTMGWQGPWRQAMEHGFAGLQKIYQRGDGFLQTLSDAKGELLDDTALLYDQAFLILALSKGATLMPDAQEAALAILGQIEDQLSLPQGGFRETGDHIYQSNPHMHLLEASLSWIEQGGDQRWHDLASQIVGHALKYFIDKDEGFLREFFDEKWAPASGTKGKVVEPGHQFEWAWLLARWFTISDNQNALQAAYRLYQAGEKGVDQSRGVAVDTMNDKLEAVTHQARLWPQTERMKSALLLSQLAQPELRGKYRLDGLNAAISLRRYLDTPLEGLWWDKLTAQNTFLDEHASGSTFYHIIEAIVQLQNSQKGV